MSNVLYTSSDDAILFSPLRYEDLRVSANSLVNGGSAASYDLFTTSTRAWKLAIDDLLFFTMQMPHAWAEGTTLYPHVHYSTDGTSTNTIKFEMIYTWQNIDGGAFPGEATISGTEAPSGTAQAHSLVYLNSVAMSGSGKTKSSIINCRLKRVTNGGTDNTDDVFVLYVDFHYAVGRLGTLSS